MLMTRTTPGVAGVGYEGQNLEQFVSSLLANNVDVLADIRLTPISRKRGFSKRALSEALREEGIEYRHLPILGNPKSNRTGFAGPESELLAARAHYEELLDVPGAHETLDHLTEVARTGRLALMCFESDDERCHRHVVLSLLYRRLEVLAA